MSLEKDCIEGRLTGREKELVKRERERERERGRRNRLSPDREKGKLIQRTSVTSKKSPNVYNSCPKMISLEK